MEYATVLPGVVVMLIGIEDRFHAYAFGITGPRRNAVRIKTSARRAGHLTERDDMAIHEGQIP
jgi:hypothetical protein